MKFVNKNIIGFILVLPLILLMSCSDNYIYDEGMIWNTTYHITYRGNDCLRDSIKQVMDSVTHSLSFFDESSLVSEFNRSESVKADRMLREVYLCSLRINKESFGRFDPTLSPLISAWGFGKNHKCNADTSRIDSIMNFVGIEKTRIDGDYIKKDDSRISFNFSAIAKGYGCDAVSRMLMRNGVKNFLVEIGGEIRLGGKSPNGEKWRVSIDRPIMSNTKEIHDSQCVIELSEGGIATSGNYRNYNTIDGKNVGHTIDRYTGRPIRTGIVSATIVSTDCMQADAYATSCMAMPLDDAVKLCKELHLSAMLIMEDGKVWVTDEFKRLYNN
ncbi:MAG: FAD:protein FMN transferase [Prevotella sp.]|nr:FAD:protein FMN transferase [Bacteroides sp.]MCM1366680.1 FAD:protein FMN transferase [Prevotella sp.]